MLLQALIVAIIVPVTAWPRVLSFDDCYDIYTVNERENYQIVWKGETTLGCRVSFHGYDSFHPLAKYQVCITVTHWSAYDASLRIIYFSGTSISREQQEYGLDDVTTIRWCSEEDHYVGVFLYEGDSVLTNSSKITLQITAKRSSTYDFSLSWVGSLIGIVVVFSLLSTATFLYRRRLCILQKQNGNYLQRNECEENGNNQQDLGAVELSIVKPPPYTAAPPPPYHAVTNPSS